MTPPEAVPAPRPAGPPPVGRRRPSGEPPPLPRNISASTRVFLALGAAVVALWVGLATDPLVRVITRADLAVLDLVERLRATPLVEVFQRVDAVLASPWTFRVVAWATLAVLAAYRRFQHLLALLAVLLVSTAVAGAVSVGLGRMRPAEVGIAAPWEGYAHPSLPVTTLGLALVAVLFTLLPEGRGRERAAWVGGGVLGLLAVARLYLAVDHPTDVAAALVVGVAVPAAAFRVLVPHEAFPISYRGRVRAHLDVGGRRGQAIRAGLEQELGLRVTAVEPFSLHGSAGSTPLRLTVAGAGGQADGYVFGKLYALTHLRSDRWYKLARTVLYGRLEDERPFNTVRRLVEYEDHMLRTLRDAGLPTATPLGIVEITPEREYLLVTEFLEGAVRITDAEVTDEVIDRALSVVRRLWDTGLAHRDIKPANVLVRDGEVLLIDTAFAEIRPTPWRQAVDLANMMLTLGLCSTAERVYERAVTRFSPDDIAEAFAASRSVTIPAQLRSLLKADGRDLLGTFRTLAGPRPPVAIQRWSVRRLVLTLSVLGGLLLGIALLLTNLELAGLL